MEEQNPEPQATDSHSDLITAFSEITSSTKQEALFFLESHNFDLDSAVSTFFESTTTAAAADPAVAQRRPSPSSSPSASPDSSSPSRSRSVSPPPSLGLQHYNLRSRNTNRAEEKKPKKPQPSTRAGGIRTISDLNRPVKEEDDDDDDDDDDSDGDYDPPQEYYTGGEKSGMLVQDPSRVNDIDALFRQAKQHAAEEGSMDHLQPSSSRSFSGRGRTLSGETVSAAPQQPDPLTRTITFWANGFTIDDGPLRRFDDPANASFLQSIAKSECPEELKSASRSGAVHVKLVRKLEEYKVPQRRNNPFQGVGRTLGDTVTEEATAPPPAPTVLSSAPTPSVGLVVDQTLPSTSIQLRLVDGTRMVSRFNYHHTINDIRSFIDASRPGGQRAYQLLTMGFPPKQLTDLNQTIEQAGLANSVVIQKF